MASSPRRCCAPRASRNGAFKLRPEARFHDGSRLTARRDVAFSHELLKTKGHPVYQQILRDLRDAEAEAPDVLRVVLADDHRRATSSGPSRLCPIFSKSLLQPRAISRRRAWNPVGLRRLQCRPLRGRPLIEMNRVPGLLGQGPAVNVGQNNFDVLRYEYFRDRTVAFEGFKGRAFTLRQEFTSRTWARATIYRLPRTAGSSASS